MSNANPIQLAIVSPCSECKNQLAEQKDGIPPCPRRQYQAWKTALEKRGADTGHMIHLAMTGTEVLAPEGGLQNLGNAVSAVTRPGAVNNLRNPVYWNTEGKGTTLLWVATLADNGPVYYADGNPVTSPLLDRYTFDTKCIRCRPLPVVPALHEAAYFTTGSFQEWDQLEVHFTGNQQLEGDGDKGNPGIVLIDGFALKVNFGFFVPRRPIPKDLTAPKT